MHTRFFLAVVCGLISAGVTFAQDSAKQGRVELAGTSGESSEAPKEVSVTVDSDEFEYRMTLVELDGRAVDEVRLAVESFVDQKGRQVVPTWGLDGADDNTPERVVAKPLAAGERKTIVVRALLPEFASYSATFTPWWGGTKHQKVVLKVVRERPALHVSLSDSTVFAQDGNTDLVTFALNVRETEDKPLAFFRPSLASLVQQMGSDAKAATIARHATLIVLAGNREVGHEVMLPRSESKDLVFQLAHFPGAGKYEAKLQFAAKGTAPLEKTVTLYVRKHWLLAAVLITLGVLVSVALRAWLGEQPQLQLLEQACRLAPEIEAAVEPGDLDDVELGLVEAARRLLADLIARVSQGREGAEDALKVMVQRVAAVRSFVAVRRAIRMVGGTAAEPFLKKLGAIRADLVDADVGVEKLTNHRSTLKAMPEEFEAALERQQVRDELTQVQQRISDATKRDAFAAEVAGMIDRGELIAARTRLGREREAIAAAAATAAGRPMGAGQPLGGPGVPRGAGVSQQPGPAFAKPKLEDSLQLARSRLERGAIFKCVVNLFILVIAVLLGMKALYLDDLTWGGAGSLLVAFLWGLGLHQFTYSGIGSLLDKVAKPQGSS